ncbi:MAG: hypothetical protein MHM6MM_002462 [Cercozoa sp. M6MM]
MEITLPRPDDLHLHVRDGDRMRDVAPLTAKYFGRALIMPNLRPPVRNAQDALAYKQRILEHTKDSFTPLMSLYLTDETTPEDIAEANQHGVVACKLYPSGATTNSSSGVTDVEALSTRGVLDAMAQHGLLLLVHAEVTTPSVDLFDRERVFIETVLTGVVQRHPQLKVVVEHCTTKAAVDFVNAQGPNVAATLTPQHLLLTRSDLFVGGLRPHRYCLPVLKTNEDRQALQEVIRSGNKKFFAGTDSAPHPIERKLASCCSAGCFSAPFALQLYATAFEQAGVDLSTQEGQAKLRAFLCENGADFYGMPRSQSSDGTVTLRREEFAVPAQLPFGDSVVVPLFAETTLPWSVVTVTN